ncbi:hypothetical protein GIS00_13565 [Nakamurella sp. YIM 132087]|uniref:Uncharacterized protein n=1 Tax=Nakamurella alba TaxID=2665158 RepID=A0A7K1FLI9_9ACTN|nr:hypothetical protein [Nakamurella alba]MTD14968.1 hypothetical protein [Nakamurella alba]
MQFLKLGEVLVVDGGPSISVRVQGLQPGDAVEVRYGSPEAPQTWHPRNGQLEWLRPTATVGELLIRTDGIPGEMTILATMAGHRAVGATVTRFGASQQTWSHPGATPREGETWAFLTLSAENGRLSLTARDESSLRERAPVGGVTDASGVAAVVDISASMAPAVADGRLATALSAVQGAAARSRMSAVTVTFVAGSWTDRITLPIHDPASDAVAAAVGKAGWRTGTPSELLGAAHGDVVWLITDAAVPLPAGRRIGVVVTAAAPTSAAVPPGPRTVVALRPGESVAELADRLLSAVTA